MNSLGAATRLIRYERCSNPQRWGFTYKVCSRVGHSKRAILSQKEQPIVGIR
jgi:hypothetical protein